MIFWLNVLSDIKTGPRTLATETRDITLHGAAWTMKVLCFIPLLCINCILKWLIRITYMNRACSWLLCRVLYSSFTYCVIGWYVVNALLGARPEHVQWTFDTFFVHGYYVQLCAHLYCTLVFSVCLLQKSASFEEYLSQFAAKACGLSDEYWYNKWNFC